MWTEIQENKWGSQIKAINQVHTQKCGHQGR